MPFAAMEQIMSDGKKYVYEVPKLFKLCGAGPCKDKETSGKYILVRDDETGWGMYDKPLRCYGCGIGWFCFLIGVLCPLVWYYATYLYFSNHYRKDPRERAGLAASAIAALICSTAAVITIFAIFV